MNETFQIYDHYTEMYKICLRYVVMFLGVLHMWKTPVIYMFHTCTTNVYSKHVCVLCYRLDRY